MMMFCSEKTFTRENLKLAFDEYVTVNGQEAATKTLMEATGVSTLADVPENKIVVGVAALISTLTISTQPSRMTARARRGKSTLAAIHSRLDELREKVFARRAT